MYRTLSGLLDDPVNGLDEARDFGFRVIVVDRGAHHALQAAFGEVKQGEVAHGYADIDVLLAE